MMKYPTEFKDHAKMLITGVKELGFYLEQGNTEVGRIIQNAITQNNQALIVAEKPVKFRTKKGMLEQPSIDSLSERATKLTTLKNEWQILYEDYKKFSNIHENQHPSFMTEIVQKKTTLDTPQPHERGTRMENSGHFVGLVTEQASGIQAPNSGGRKL